MNNDPILQAVETQLKNIEKSTGKSIADWTRLIKESGLSKHGELVAMLKSQFGMGHGNANALVHTAMKSHATAAENETDWLEEQYKGKENLRRLYDELATKIQSMGGDVVFSPKKAYMSVRRKKQFAIIQPSTKARLDIGLNLKGVAPDGMLEQAGSWNSMCTHRIKLEENANIHTHIFQWLQMAYDQAG